MPRFKLIIQYKGTNYSGWQVQPNGTTVQEIVQKVLSRILNARITVVAASRTDSGVHALGQVCHFDLPHLTSPYKGEESPLRRKVPEGDKEGSGEVERLHHSLNSLLPPDIVVTSLEPVSDTFHAQKSAKKKIYDYFILHSKIRSPFLNDFVWPIPYSLDLKKMKQAAKMLVGEHDFKAFAASDSSAKTMVRRIYGIVIASASEAIQLVPRGFNGIAASSFDKLRTPRNDNIICISLTGNGFLKQMVRNIVGTLVAVGNGKMTIQEFKKAFASRDRRKTGQTAPAKGLVLREVIY